MNETTAMASLPVVGAIDRLVLLTEIEVFTLHRADAVHFI